MTSKPGWRREHARLSRHNDLAKAMDYMLKRAGPSISLLVDVGVEPSTGKPYSRRTCQTPCRVQPNFTATSLSVYPLALSLNTSKGLILDRRHQPQREIELPLPILFTHSRLDTSKVMPMPPPALPSSL